MPEESEGKPSRSGWRSEPSSESGWRSGSQPESGWSSDSQPTPGRAHRAPSISRRPNAPALRSRSPDDAPSISRQPNDPTPDTPASGNPGQGTPGQVIPAQTQLLGQPGPQQAASQSTAVIAESRPAAQQAQPGSPLLTGHSPTGHAPASQTATPNLQPINPKFAAKRGNGLAVAGFVCSLCTILFVWTILPVPILWICGLVFSGIGLHRSLKHGLPSRGLAIAGLVISVLTLVAAFTALYLFVVFLESRGGDWEFRYDSDPTEIELDDSLDV